MCERHDFDHEGLVYRNGRAKKGGRRWPPQRGYKNFGPQTYGTCISSHLYSYRFVAAIADKGLRQHTDKTPKIEAAKHAQ